MKFMAIILLISTSVLAQDPRSTSELAAECRHKIEKSGGNLYVEDMERCQGIFLRHSIERFNDFSDKRAPAVDCQEARDNQSLVNTCRAAGIRKVKAQGKARNLNVRDEDVYACDVDNSHWFTSNYVWYCADTPGDNIRVLTQKPFMGDCF